MNTAEHTWAVVLAAGEGSRLRSLTTMSTGVAVPKQFCSLHGGPSLLQEAIGRSRAVAPQSRICAVVADQHRGWWEEALCELPSENIIVQPENRGTAIGILLPLLHIERRDPAARVVLLPSDHYVRDEQVLAASLRQAVSRLEANPSEIVLLGLAPEFPDPELGYIVPSAGQKDGAQRVAQFVEKPSSDEAATLIARGALWNAFIVAARAQALLELYAQRWPAMLAELRAAIALDARDPTRPNAARRVYRSLPSIDFSRDLLDGAESWLRVLPAPACGWSDLGTPERVAHTLRCAPTREQRREEIELSGWLNLSRQHSLLQGAPA